MLLPPLQGTAGALWRSDDFLSRDRRSKGLLAELTMYERSLSIMYDNTEGKVLKHANKEL